MKYKLYNKRNNDEYPQIGDLVVYEMFSGTLLYGIVLKKVGGRNLKTYFFKVDNSAAKNKLTFAQYGIPCIADFHETVLFKV